MRVGRTSPKIAPGATRPNCGFVYQYTGLLLMPAEAMCMDSDGKAFSSSASGMKVARAKKK
jgi:hypothetical protein